MKLFEIFMAKHKILNEEEDKEATELIRQAGALPNDVYKKLKR
jgi:hypothetical protein